MSDFKIAALYRVLLDVASESSIEVQVWKEKFTLADEDGVRIFSGATILECLAFCRGYKAGKRHYEVNP